MIMRSKIAILLCIGLFPCLSYSMLLPQDFPAGFLYNKQAIDPLCLEQAQYSKGLVSLGTCGIQANSENKVSGENKQLVDKGFVGFNYVWQSSSEPEQKSNAYSYYKVFNAGKNTYIVYLLSSGGGSGQFSSLFQVQRQGDNLTVTTLVSGDRCNNGISAVEKKDQLLTYRVNLTAFDYLDLVNQNPHQLAAYDDLGACATCCQGAAVYELDLNKDTEQKLAYVDIGDVDQAGMQGKYHGCFNNVIDAYRKQGKLKLDLSAVQELVKTFNTQCVK